MILRVLAMGALLGAVAACSHRSSTFSVGGIEGLEDDSIRYRDVAILDVAGGITVGLTVDGAMQLYGLALDPPSHSFPGYYRAMGVSNWGEHGIVCGLTHGGAADCVVIPPEGWPEPPVIRSIGPTPYQQLRGNCGLCTDQHLACFAPPGLPTPPNLDVPEGRFVALDATPELSCALREDGELVCWGGQVPELAPSQDIAWLRLFGSFPLGFAVDGALLPLAGPGQVPKALQRIPEGHYADVWLAGTHGCALDTDGSVVCFGRPPRDDDGRLLREILRPPPEGFQAFAVGQAHACGVRVDGRLICWGACSGDPARCGASSD